MKCKNLRLQKMQVKSETANKTLLHNKNQKYSFNNNNH